MRQGQISIIQKVVIKDCLGRKIYQDFDLSELKSGRTYAFESFEIPQQPIILENGFLLLLGEYTVFPKEDNTIKIQWGSSKR